MARRVYNWSRVHHCRPRRIEEPSSEAEVVALIQRARRAGAKLRVIGARHSWSDIAMSDDLLVTLDGMQRIRAVDERGEDRRVRVEAGIRLHRLNDELAARGLALPILGSVTEQSLAGVMSTGTHGSSMVHGNIPSTVVGMRLATGTGEVLELDEEHPLLPAARVGLGMLGIITEVTIRVDPSFRLLETSEALDFDEAVARMDELARSAEYVKLWWVPHTGKVVVFRCQRCDEPGELSKLGRWLDTWVVNKLVFAALLRSARWLPALTPGANRLVAQTYFRPRRRVARSDHVLSLAMPPIHREMEYSLPVELAGEALRRARALVEREGLRVNFINELRFVAADDGWMSPAGGRDSCQLGAYMAQAPGIDRFFSGFEAEMKQLGGRPHWGKEFRAGPEEILAMYPKAAEFFAKARELDPDGLFRNRFVERICPR